MMSVLHGPRREVRKVLHDGLTQWVRPEGDELVLPDGRRICENEAHYLPPCNPSKIICVHVNSRSRFAEFKDVATNPSYFQKPTTSLNSHRGKIHRPDDCRYLNYEGEIAVQFGKVVKGLEPGEIWDVIDGFAPVNDVGLQDFRDIDRGSMLRVKGQDGFCPIGPGMVSGVDIRQQVLRTWINGKMVQEGAVDEFVFSMGFMVADLSRYMTFLPGDILLTGTPANSRPMSIGDRVEVEVSEVGRLTNTVAEIPAARHKIGHQPTDSDTVRVIALGGDFVPPDAAGRAGRS
ncbi:fumarylacetoacetate hydrolase family protein [Bradyrhizobium septentrionale]|uniref:fumarylacetoacetate hydrolase family protein n=1 Tax=Bradyrhizobium septentrionale TaxID=1404411 RepID=UPI001CD234B5|nr:fumarylacetoacetate hydrolase family protein [Bradyrhizobium septentrionale]UGY24896.1 fumarylacetoacetate hydrolase family protein [Bradyrhizobium septentrionale]